MEGVDTGRAEQGYSSDLPESARFKGTGSHVTYVSFCILYARCIFRSSADSQFGSKGKYMQHAHLFLMSRPYTLFLLPCLTSVESPKT